MDEGRQGDWGRGTTAALRLNGMFSFPDATADLAFSIDLTHTSLSETETHSPGFCHPFSPFGATPGLCVFPPGWHFDAKLLVGCI